MLRRRRARGDAGFTLIELVVAVAVLGIIAAPLAGVIISYFRNADATTARLTESHDAQIATAWVSQDVRSLGVRDYTATGTAGFFPLTQSVETAAAPTAGLFPCGTAATGTAVLRLGWDDFRTGPAGPATQVRVAYVVQGSELHRLQCAGSSAVATDTRIASHLVAPFASVTCADTAGTVLASCAGSGAAVPRTVSLTLTIHDPSSPAGTTYPVTVTGQRRQS